MAYPPLQETIHVTDLTIYHWAALMNVRRIAAIRSLKLCYRALLRAVLDRVANDPSTGERQNNAAKRLEEKYMGSAFLAEIEDEKSAALRRRWTVNPNLNVQQQRGRIVAREALYRRLVRARWLFLTRGNSSPLDSDEKKFAPELATYDNDIKLIMAHGDWQNPAAANAAAPEHRDGRPQALGVRDRALTRGETWLRVCELTRLVRCWRHWHRLEELLAAPDGIIRLQSLATELPWWLEQDMRDAGERRRKRKAADETKKQLQKQKKAENEEQKKQAKKAEKRAHSSRDRKQSSRRRSSKPRRRQRQRERSHSDSDS
jgi:hypothetical protein